MDKMVQDQKKKKKKKLFLRMLLMNKALSNVTTSKLKHSSYINKPLPKKDKPY